MLKKHLNFSSLITQIDKAWSKIADHRQKSKVKISLSDALKSALACMFFKDPSLLQFQGCLKEAASTSDLETLFGVVFLRRLEWVQFNG